MPWSFKSYYVNICSIKITQNYKNTPNLLLPIFPHWSPLRPMIAGQGTSQAKPIFSRLTNKSLEVPPYPVVRLRVTSSHVCIAVLQLSLVSNSSAPMGGNQQNEIKRLFAICCVIFLKYIFT